MMAAMKLARALLFRGCYLLVMAFCAAYLVTHFIQRTGWYKERLYQRLFASGGEERLRTAGGLVRFGGQEQLLRALKSDDAGVRDVARRALEILWFNAAGDEAYQLTQAAFRASEKSDHLGALKILNRLVEKFPKFAEGWNRRASVHWELGEYEKSIADSERALALNPNHYGAWQGIGVCRLKLGDVAEACRCLRAALKIVPHDPVTRESLHRCEELLRTHPEPGRKTRPMDLI